VSDPWDDLVRDLELTSNAGRREARVEDITFDDIEEEARTGKELVLGFDLNCRPVLYMHPDRQNTTQSPRQIDFVVWCLERTIDLCPPSDPAIEMLCLLIDFGASRGSKAPPTSIGQAKKVCVPPSHSGSCSSH
jgi:hypothetical protein